MSLSKKSLVVSVFFAIFLTGCGTSQSILNLQKDKDNYCLNQIELAYNNLQKGKNVLGGDKEIYYKKSFEIIKKANEQKCTSSHLFLALHYNYGIGTNIDLRKRDYHLKLDEHYRLLSVEQRLSEQGTNLPSNNKE